MANKDTRERVAQLFGFLKEYAAIRFPIVRDLNDPKIRWKLSLDELPTHPAISVSQLTAEERDDGGNGNWRDGGESTSQTILIRGRRPPRSTPPALPHTLEGWVEGTTDDPRVEPVILAEREIPDPNGEVHIERFEDDEARCRDWSQWLERWRTWAQNERPAREAQEIYERFYELHGELQREGERYELILADGVAFWKWEGGAVYFPLILMPVQLKFNPDVPEFTIIETGKNPELYTALLQEAPVTNTDVLPSMREQLTSGAQLIHPLEEADTTAYLRSLAHALSPDGEFIPKPSELTRVSGTHLLRIWRQPMLLLRPRAQGYLWSIQNVLEDLKRREELPEALVPIVGITAPRPHATTSDERTLSDDDLGLLESVSFTKPWNREQLQIAARLDRFGAVLVQGPPGTGKTHTIANLIGHLLAQGKSVLVTAHTSKALRVLREHIPEPLRSLAVSVLDDDLESRRQLEEAVCAITQRLSDGDSSRLHETARRLEEERRQLLRHIARMRQELVEAVGSEYRSIVVAGQEYRPSDAARRVAEGTGCDDWIPGPVESGAALSLSQEELADLYRLNRELTEADEQELSVRLPDPQVLFDPDELDQMVALIREKPNGHRPEWWLRPHTRDEIPDLQAVAEKARALGQRVRQAEPWELDLTLSAAEEHETFEDMLLGKAEHVKQFVASHMALLIEHDPTLPDDRMWDEHERVAKELAARAQRRGGQLSRLDLWLVRLFNRRQWRFIRSTRVAGRKPIRAEHFQVLAAEAEIQKERQRLQQAWERLITRRGGPDPKSLGPEPEKIISGKWAPRFRDSFRLPQDISDLQDERRRLGVAPHALQELGTGETIEHWHRWAEFLLDSLPKAVGAAVLVIHQREAQRHIQEMQEYLASFEATPTLGDLKDALRREDPEAYRKAHERLCELHARHDRFRRRQELLEKLARVAPGWADAIRTRSGVHGQAELPGDPYAAWLWRQLHDELVRRHGQDVQKLQQQLEEYWERLRDVTRQIVETRTWAYRIEKTTQEQRQALVGWANTMRRLGKGRGRSAPRLRREASALLSKAKDAVPVWIMPLPRVLEQFDAATTRFDVVIVDEASQCDMLGLVALYLGNEVVVVGDHEQVSPEGVGQELRSLERLQDEHLRGIPNAHLYDGKRSLYDIARESFGGGLMLTEHFRCVPEIIQFSNRLCYRGRIRPLRESHSTPLKPPIVPYRVRGTRYNRVNEEEAETIAALILAMLQHSAYAEKTIGVISMVGEEQAKHIERLVRRLCLDDPKIERELERRKFLCGTSAQFQGDERDVVLLSLVDAPNPDGPLPLRNDDRFKQRFNVAASRARDQLWVIYSLDPANDLKEGDLRRELIQFALQVHSNPESVIQIPEAERTESPFEREVLEYLVDRGYRVHAQWPVGSYRIDLVIEGETSGGEICRVAIECDGDRYHPIEKIPEDLERQAVLERLGWRFIRIRGSEFYRDRASTIQRVEEELKRMGIRPRGQFPSGAKSTPPSLAAEIIREAERIRAEMRAATVPSTALSTSDIPHDAPRPDLAPSALLSSSVTETVSNPSVWAYGQQAQSSLFDAAVHPLPGHVSFARSLEDHHSRTGEPLTEQDLRELRSRILEERERNMSLCQSLQIARGELSALLAREFETIWHHYLEDGEFIVSELEKVLTLQSQVTATLQLIEDALAKLDAGQYGTCEWCGMPIGLGRLRALPWARLCVECQARAEQEGDKSSSGFRRRLWLLARRY